MLSKKVIGALALIVVVFSTGLMIWPQGTNFNLVVAGCFAAYSAFLWASQMNRLMIWSDFFALGGFSLTLIFGAATLDEPSRTGSVITLCASAASVIFASVPNNTERLSSR